MITDIQTILLIAAGIYLVTGIILISFPEKIYKWAKGTSIPDSGKGLFAQALISYYHIKTKGVSATSKDWLYCFGFNAGISIGATLVVAFGVGLIMLAVGLIISVIILMILGAALK